MKKLLFAFLLTVPLYAADPIPPLTPYELAYQAWVDATVAWEKSDANLQIKLAFAALSGASKTLDDAALALEKAQRTMYCPETVLPPVCPGDPSCPCPNPLRADCHSLGAILFDAPQPGDLPTDAVLLGTWHFPAGSLKCTLTVFLGGAGSVQWKVENQDATREPVVGCGTWTDAGKIGVIVPPVLCPDGSNPPCTISTAAYDKPQTGVLPTDTTLKAQGFHVGDTKCVLVSTSSPKVAIIPGWLVSSHLWCPGSDVILQTYVHADPVTIAP